MRLEANETEVEFVPGDSGLNLARILIPSCVSIFGWRALNCAMVFGIRFIPGVVLASNSGKAG